MLFHSCLEWRVERDIKIDFGASLLGPQNLFFKIKCFSKKQNKQIKKINVKMF